jgi:hypothetical protein
MYCRRHYRGIEACRCMRRPEAGICMHICATTRHSTTKTCTVLTESAKRSILPRSSTSRLSREIRAKTRGFALLDMIHSEFGLFGC